MLEAEPAEAKAAHAQLDDIPAWSKADATKTRANFESSMIRFGEVEQAETLASASLNAARKPSVESAKNAEEALRQLTEVSCQAQLFEGEFSSLKSLMCECTKTRDDAASSATEHSRVSRMPGACLSL